MEFDEMNDENAEEGGGEESTCPACGLERKNWTGNGYEEETGETYCCRGCAEGMGCVCEAGLITETGTEQVTPTPSRLPPSKKIHSPSRYAHSHHKLKRHKRFSGER